MDARREPFGTHGTGNRRHLVRSFVLFVRSFVRSLFLFFSSSSNFGNPFLRAAHNAHLSNKHREEILFFCWWRNVRFLFCFWLFPSPGHNWRGNHNHNHNHHHHRLRRRRRRRRRRHHGRRFRDGRIMRRGGVFRRRRPPKWRKANKKKRQRNARARKETPTPSQTTATTTTTTSKRRPFHLAHL